MRIRAALVRLIAVVGLVAPMGVVAASTSTAAVTCPPRLGLTWFTNNFDAGTTIPYTNTDYVSQGLAYWPAKDWIITSLNDDTWLPGRNMLAVKNRSTGTLVKRVFVQYSNGAEITGHMGGVSVAGGSLLLSTSSGDKNLFRFSLKALEQAPHNTALKTNGSFAVRASSYNTAASGYLYVGLFTDALTGTSTMWRYKLSSTQAPTGTPVAISTPTRVQGAVVADGYYIFSTSYGRHCYSRLKFKRITTGGYGRPIEIPPMSEGIVNVPRGASGPASDWVYVNFESGSDQFKDGTMRQFRFQHALLTSLTP